MMLFIIYFTGAFFFNPPPQHTGGADRERGHLLRPHRPVPDIECATRLPRGLRDSRISLQPVWAGE